MHSAKQRKKTKLQNIKHMKVLKIWTKNLKKSVILK